MSAWNLPQPVVDVGWEGLPNWIVAVTGALTLIAAVVAASFAGAAAFAARRQTAAAVQQADLAREQVNLARREADAVEARAERQHQQIEHDRRVQEQSRLDQLAPTIWATARRQILERGPRGNTWQVTAVEEMPAGEDDLFWLIVTIDFQNVSDRIARIDLTQPDGGEFDVRSGEGIFLAPGATRSLSWIRVIHSSVLRTDEGVNDPAHWWMRVRYWVRDLGMNVRDEFQFSGDFRHFKVDGSRLIVDPGLPFPWTTAVGEPVSPRTYERLEAGTEGISPAS